ncbi:unnamed protein product [Closterium sp. Naga37s-1]|nr:unnamed protein product [Closterium sp. Naga37s-1]
MASAPQVRAELWTPPLPAKPSFPPSAPPASAPPLSAPPPSVQPPPPLPFHLWRRRQQRRVRSAFSAASGARKQWDAASADGLRAATAVLPGKGVGPLGSMEGIVARAADKIRRLMQRLPHTFPSFFPSLSSVTSSPSFLSSPHLPSLSSPLAPQSFLTHTSLFSFSSPCSTSPAPRPPFSRPPPTPTTISCMMLCSG